MTRSWRVTIARRDGTFYARDVDAEEAFEAKRAVLLAYRAKYDEPIDGHSHWVARCVEIVRPAYGP